MRALQDKEANFAVSSVTARSKWCMTGTPVGHSSSGSIDTDLNRLFSALGLPAVQAFSKNPQSLGYVLQVGAERREGQSPGTAQQSWF